MSKDIVFLNLTQPFDAILRGFRKVHKNKTPIFIEFGSDMPKRKMGETVVPTSTSGKPYLIALNTIYGMEQNAETLVHELAHVAQSETYDINTIKPHGKEFKYILNKISVSCEKEIVKMLAKQVIKE